MIISLISSRLRRRFAGFVYPEMKAEITAAVMVELESKRTTPRNFNEKHQRRLGDDIRVLDAHLRAHLSRNLLWTDVRATRKAPLNAGPLNDLSATAVFAALRRLRHDPAAGCKAKLHKNALQLFQAIWPEDLEWPEGIPRPRPIADGIQGDAA